jgi:hypothetical protein
VIDMLSLFLLFIAFPVFLLVLLGWFLIQVTK